MMNSRFCPKCGNVEGTRIEKREETLTVRGEPITHLASVRICESCGEAVFDEELDTQSLDDVYAIYRRRHDLIEPKEIASIRKQYGLSQRGLSRLLGLGDVTIHRYESGALPEEAYSHLFRLLKDPHNMKGIFEERKERLSRAASKKTALRLDTLLAEAGPELDRRTRSRRGRRTPGAEREAQAA